MPRLQSLVTQSSLSGDAGPLLLSSVRQPAGDISASSASPALSRSACHLALMHAGQQAPAQTQQRHVPQASNTSNCPKSGACTSKAPPRETGQHGD